MPPCNAPVSEILTYFNKWAELRVLNIFCFYFFNVYCLLFGPNFENLRYLVLLFNSLCWAFHLADFDRKRNYSDLCNQHHLIFHQRRNDAISASYIELRASSVCQPPTLSICCPETWSGLERTVQAFNDIVRTNCLTGFAGYSQGPSPPASFRYLKRLLVDCREWNLLIVDLGD